MKDTIYLSDAEKPVTAAQVARRSLILAAIVCRASLENSAGQTEAEALHLRILAWTSELNLWREVEPNEKRILRTPLGMLEQKNVTQANWYVEGLAVLAWALHCFDYPRHDQEVDPYDVAEAVWFLSDDAEEWIGAVNLRSPTQLEACREFLYSIHSRLRDFLRHRSRKEFTLWIEKDWMDALGLATLPLIVENDLAIGGRPMEEAKEDRLQVCEKITNERHRAAIWLLGDYPLYSELPIDT